MKKIIPFKKEIIFKDNLFEITSISLEHNFSIKENSVVGEFIVSGEYKVTDTSDTVESFSYNLPFEINLDEKYILNKAYVDIDDFYYEIINDKVLSVNIEILIDKIEEKAIINYEDNDIMEDKKNMCEERNDKEESIINAGKNNIIEEKRCIEDEASIDSIIDNVNDSKEIYKSYSVYIVREGDTLETIMGKYNITKEELEDYNDLKEIKIGDKVIIPCNV